MGGRTEVLSVAEADALFEAAEYARKHRWRLHVNDELKHLNAAIKKLRHAHTLHIEQDE